MARRARGVAPGAARVVGERSVVMAAARWLRRARRCDVCLSRWLIGTVCIAKAGEIVDRAELNKGKEFL